MPSYERAICHRLRQFRIETGLSQAQFAVLARLNQRAYAGFEYARTQLNYQAAQKILTRYSSLNPLWLLDGHGEMQARNQFAFPSLESLGVGERALFSNVFNERLKRDYLSSPPWNFSGQWTPVNLFNIRPTPQGRLMCKDRLGDLLAEWVAELPDDKVSPFFNEVFAHAAKIIGRYPHDPDSAAVEARFAAMMEIEKARRFVEATSSEQKTGLTIITQYGKTGGVKSELQRLIARVKRATSRPGSKSELARFLDVAPARITEWLSDEEGVKREPGGYYALEMLKWVEQQERNK